MKNKELIFLLRYASSYSILIVDKNNELVELSCPFNVVARYNKDILLKGNVYEVERIKLSEQLSLVYVIGKNLFHYNHFEIIV